MNTSLWRVFFNQLGKVQIMKVIAMHDNGCFLYTPILLLEPKIFNGVLVFADYFLCDKVFD